MNAEHNIEDHSATVYAPRHPAFVFLLTYLTFSVASWFWLVARVREIKQITQKDFTPWLWFFVFLGPIFQLFALPKLFNTIKEIDSRQENPEFKAAPVLLVLFPLLSLFFNIVEKIEISFIYYFLALCIWSILVAILQQRFNLISNNLPDGSPAYKKKKIKYGFRFWEWPLLIIGTVLHAVIIYETVRVDELQSNNPVLESSKLTAEGHPFELPIIQKGWSKIPIGSASDGSSELELQGPLSDMNIVIFHHGIDETVSSISNWREDELLKRKPSHKCKQERVFENGTTNITSVIECFGKNMGDPEAILSKTINTSKGVYEVYGHYSAPKFSFNNHKKHFIETINGFKQQ
ncbi:MAG: hypothetical protein K6L73_04625 [Cellvibrionaceae bacterium]